MHTLVMLIELATHMLPPAAMLSTGFVLKPTLFNIATVRATRNILTFQGSAEPCISHRDRAFQIRRSPACAVSVSRLAADPKEQSTGRRAHWFGGRAGKDGLAALHNVGEVHKHGGNTLPPVDNVHVIVEVIEMRPVLLRRLCGHAHATLVPWCSA